MGVCVAPWRWESGPSCRRGVCTTQDQVRARELNSLHARPPQAPAFKRLLCILVVFYKITARLFAVFTTSRKCQKSNPHRPLPHIKNVDSLSADLDAVSWLQMARLLSPAVDQQLPSLETQFPQSWPRGSPRHPTS